MELNALTLVARSYALLPNNIRTEHQPEPVTNVGLTTINVSIVVILRTWHISGSRTEPNTIKLLAVYVSLLTLGVLGGMTICGSFKHLNIWSGDCMCTLSRWLYHLFCVDKYYKEIVDMIIRTTKYTTTVKKIGG